MADCFSLPNAAELCGEVLAEAKRTAETINELRKDNAKLKAERDAALEDLKKYADCDVCKYNTEECLNNGFCKECSVGKSTRNSWEWRGVTDTNVGSKKEEQ